MGSKPTRTSVVRPYLSNGQPLFKRWSECRLYVHDLKKEETYKSNQLNLDKHLQSSDDKFGLVVLESRAPG